MTSREEFEELVRSSGEYEDKTDRGEYRSAKTEFAWRYWQAATERAAKIADKDHYGEWLAAAIRAR